MRDGPAPTLERGAVRGMCRGPAILPAPARAQSPAARKGSAGAPALGGPRGRLTLRESGSFVPQAGGDPARRTVEGRHFRGDPGAARIRGRGGASGARARGGPWPRRLLHCGGVSESVRGDGQPVPDPRTGPPAPGPALCTSPAASRRAPGPDCPGAPGRRPLPLPAPRPQRARTCGLLCAFG